MRKAALLFIFAIGLSGAVWAQAPCSASPLQFPLNFGDTSLSSQSGGGLAGPYAPPVPCNAYGDNDTSEDWYEWTAPSDGILLVTTCGGNIPGAFASFDSSLAIWSGNSCASTLNFEACNGDGNFASCPAFESEIFHPVTAGVTYWIKVNGWMGGNEGPYALGADFTATGPRLTLDLNGGFGTLNIDIINGTAGAQYFNAFSFDPINSLAPGTGWWGGLHITLPQVLDQIQFPVPPFRGFLDPAGSAPFAFSYPPTFSGLEVFAVTFTWDPAGNWIGQSPVARFIF